MTLKFVWVGVVSVWGITSDQMTKCMEFVTIFSSAQVGFFRISRLIPDGICSNKAQTTWKSSSFWWCKCCSAIWSDSQEHLVMWIPHTVYGQSTLLVSCQASQLTYSHFSLALYQYLCTLLPVTENLSFLNQQKGGKLHVTGQTGIQTCNPRIWS